MRNTTRGFFVVLLTAWAVQGAIAQGSGQAGQGQPNPAATPAQPAAGGQNAAPAQSGSSTSAPTQSQAGVDAGQPEETLMEVYQRALQSDPTIREAEANYQASAEAKPQARSSILPTLSLSDSNAGSFNKSPFGRSLGTGQVIGTGSETSNSSQSMEITLTQTLFDWARFATLKQADKRVAQAQATYEAAKQDLMIRVATAYFGVLGAQDTLQAAIAARDSVSQQLEQAQRRFDVGLIAITDVQESKAGYDAAVATVIAAQQTLATARESLREIIGDLVTNLAAPTANLPLETPNPNNADRWVQMALKQNLSLVSTRLQADIAEDNITIERASRLPTLNLSASYSKQDSSGTSTLKFAGQPDVVFPFQSQPKGYNWQLSLQVPIYTGGLNGSRIRQAVYQQRAAQQQSELVARQTERQTRDAYLGVISEISRVRALRQSVESSQTALRAARAGFQVGTRTTVDVLTAQNNLQQAQTNYAASRYDYILNELKLKQAAGILAVADMQQVETWLK